MSAPCSSCSDGNWLIEQARAAIAAHEANEDRFEERFQVEHAARMAWYAEQLAIALEKHHAGGPA